MALDGVPQFCNATGTAAGVCTPATPAGNKCTANLGKSHLHVQAGITPVYTTMQASGEKLGTEHV